MFPAKFFSRALPLLLLSSAALSPLAHATSITKTGTLQTDESVFEYTFNVSSAANYDFYTTSYAGGSNLNGSTSVAGGFVPILSLFNSSTGSFIGTAGGGGLASCGGSSAKDPKTGLCNDASLLEMLAAGSYTLALTELGTAPNGPNLSDGFFSLGSTGSLCGSSGSFLETDIAPCAKRTDKYAVNIESTAPVPEPSTLALVLSGTGIALVIAKRQLA